MLKILFFIVFIIPICFIRRIYWTVQNLIFLGIFLFLLLNFDFDFFCISYIFGIDLLSFGLIILSFWICSLIIIASSSIFFLQLNIIKFSFNVFILLFFLVLSFSSLNLFFFYLFFESRLIPTLFLILGWGYQPERLQAGLYLLFYTLFASLPLLMVLFYIDFLRGSLVILNLLNFRINYYLFYVFLVFAFLVKIPIFIVHLWLPKAHVEAPISGSIILAGVLLKLGGYGLLRVLNFLIFIFNFNSIFIIFRLLGGVLVSLVCLRQIDLKSLVAYSSVAHMRIVIGGIFTLNSWGWGFSYSLIIAHGLCSSGLFYLVNLFYERLIRRSLLINKGIIIFFPSIRLWWFLLCSRNIAAPPSLNLIGEIGLINRVLSWSKSLIILVSFISFFRAVYSLYLFSFSQQGKIRKTIFSFSFGYLREYLVLFLHWFPLNILFFKREIIIILF